MPLGIEFDGHITLEINSAVISLEAHGKTLHAEIGDFRMQGLALRTIFQARKALRVAARLLNQANLRLCVTRHERVIFECGADVQPDRLSGLLGLPNARTHFRGS